MQESTHEKEHNHHTMGMKRFILTSVIVMTLASFLLTASGEKSPKAGAYYDIGAFQTHYYMAMEYVEGGITLKERIQPWRWPPGRGIQQCRPGHQW